MVSSSISKDDFANQSHEVLYSSRLSFEEKNLLDEITHQFNAVQEHNQGRFFNKLVSNFLSQDNVKDMGHYGVAMQAFLKENPEHFKQGNHIESMRRTGAFDALMRAELSYPSVEADAERVKLGGNLLLQPEFIDGGNDMERASLLHRYIQESHSLGQETANICLEKTTAFLASDTCIGDLSDHALPMIAGDVHRFWPTEEGAEALYDTIKGNSRLVKAVFNDNGNTITAKAAANSVNAPALKPGQ